LNFLSFSLGGALAASVLIPRGHSLWVIVLLGIILCERRKAGKDRSKGRLFYVEPLLYILCFGFIFIAWAHHSIDFREIDKWSKPLLAGVISFFLFSVITSETLAKIKANMHIIMLIGIFGIVLRAFIDLYIYNDLYVGRHMNRIQFGLISSFIVIFYAYFSGLGGENWLTRVFLFGGAIATLSSGSAAAAIMLFVGLFYVFVITKKKILILGLILVSSWGAVDDHISGNIMKLAGLTDIPAIGSVGTRISLAKEAVESVKKNYMWGVGDGFKEAMRKRVGENNLISENAEYDTPHNDFLDSFVKYGVFGVTSYFLLISIPFVFAHRNGFLERRKDALLLAVLAFVAGGAQSFLAHNSGMMFFLFLSLLLMLNMVSQGEEREK